MTRKDDAAARPAETRAGLGLIALLTVMIMVNQMATSLYTPSLPSLTTAFAAEAADVKLTMSVFLFGLTIGQLVHGPLSDRFGRRPILLAGLGIYVLATAMCAAAPTLTILILGRLLQALGGCACAVVSRAIVRDKFGRGEAARVMAMVGLAMAVGPALGPMIGGLLQVSFGWRACFVVLLFFGLAVFVWVAAGYRESLAQPNPTATDPLALARSFAAVLSSRPYLAYSLATGFCFSTMFAYQTGGPFVLIELLGLRPDVFGMSYGFIVVGYLVGMAMATWWSARIGHDRMIRLGALSMLAAAAVMLTAALAGRISVPLVLGAMSVVMFGFSLITPNAMSGAMMPFPAIAGVAAAGLGFAQMGVSALGSYAVGFFFDGTAAPMAAVIAVSALGCTLCAFALPRRAAM